MRHLKSKIVIGVILVAFVLGSTAGFAVASRNWAGEVFAKASADIGKAGYNKKEELIQNMDERISQHVAAETDGKIDNKEVEVENELENYFEDKLYELTDSPDFQALDGQMEGLKEEVVDRYKDEIDEAFNNM